MGLALDISWLSAVRPGVRLFTDAELRKNTIEDLLVDDAARDRAGMVEGFAQFQGQQVQLVNHLNCPFQCRSRISQRLPVSCPQRQPLVRVTLSEPPASRWTEGRFRSLRSAAGPSDAFGGSAVPLDRVKLSVAPT